MDRIFVILGVVFSGIVLTSCIKTESYKSDREKLDIKIKMPDISSFVPCAKKESEQGIGEELLKGKIVFEDSRKEEVLVTKDCSGKIEKTTLGAEPFQKNLEIDTERGVPVGTKHVVIENVRTCTANQANLIEEDDFRIKKIGREYISGKRYALATQSGKVKVSLSDFKQLKMPMYLSVLPGYNLIKISYYADCDLDPKSECKQFKDLLESREIVVEAKISVEPAEPSEPVDKCQPEQR